MFEEQQEGLYEENKVYRLWGLVGRGAGSWGSGYVGASRSFSCTHDQMAFRSHRRVVNKEVKRSDIHFEKMDWGRARTKGGYQVRGNDGLE